MHVYLPPAERQKERGVGAGERERKTEIDRQTDCVSFKAQMDPNFASFEKQTKPKPANKQANKQKTKKNPKQASKQQQNKTKKPSKLTSEQTNKQENALFGTVLPGPPSPHSALDSFNIWQSDLQYNVHDPSEEAAQANHSTVGPQKGSIPRLTGSYFRLPSPPSKCITVQI